MSKFEFNIQNTFLVLQGNLHFSNSCMMMNVFLKKLGDQCDFTKKVSRNSPNFGSLRSLHSFHSLRRYFITMNDELSS